MGALGKLKPKLVARDWRTVPVRPKTVSADLKGSTYETWRKLVLDRAHWRCEAEGCGAQGGRGGVRLYADHKVERRDGGALYDPENGQALCAKHHGQKTAAERARRAHDRHSIED